jgi:hypothetical protein
MVANNGEGVKKKSTSDDKMFRTSLPADKPVGISVSLASRLG